MYVEFPHKNFWNKQLVKSPCFEDFFVDKNEVNSKFNIIFNKTFEK